MVEFYSSPSGSCTSRPRATPGPHRSSAARSLKVTPLFVGAEMHRYWEPANAEDRSTPWKLGSLAKKIRSIMKPFNSCAAVIGGTL